MYGGGGGGLKCYCGIMYALSFFLDGNIHNNNNDNDYNNNNTNSTD